MKYRIKAHATDLSGKVVTMWLQTTYSRPGRYKSFNFNYTWLYEGGNSPGEPTNFKSLDDALAWIKHLLIYSAITDAALIKVSFGSSDLREDFR